MFVCEVALNNSFVFRHCKGMNSLKLTKVKAIILRINFRIIVTC